MSAQLLISLSQYLSLFFKKVAPLCINVIVVLVTLDDFSVIKATVYDRARTVFKLSLFVSFITSSDSMSAKRSDAANNNNAPQ